MQSTETELQMLGKQKTLTKQIKPGIILQLVNENKHADGGHGDMQEKIPSQQKKNL